MPPKQKPRSASSMPTSQRKKAATGITRAAKPPSKAVVARRTRQQGILKGELLPSLLDLDEDANGVLSTKLPAKPPKCPDKIWGEFVAHVRRRDVCYLRIHHGLSTADCAAYLGISERMAQDDWQGRLKQPINAEIQDLRAIEVQRMDDWLSMLEPNIRKEVERSFVNPRFADYRALDKAIKIQQNRIRLLGLERPIDTSDPDEVHHSITQVNVHVDMRATAAEYIAGVLAGGSADPHTIINTLKEITEGAPSTTKLEGEALEDFLALANSEVEILDVEEIHAEANRVLTPEDALQEEETP